MARKPVNYQIDQPLLRPQAQMVDTYEAPGASPLRGLAESLSSLNGKIQGILGERDRKKNDDDKLRGEAAYYEQNAEGYAEGVRNDSIPANQSPGFQEGFRNAQGYVAGGDLRLKFSAALDQALPSFGDDPAAYDKFVATFIQGNIRADSDPDVLRTLLPQVKSLYGEGYGRYTDYRSKAVYEGSATTHGAIISQTIDQATADGLSDPEGTNYDAVTLAITTVRDNFIKSGGRHEDADKLVIDAVTSKALQLQDRDLLNVLKEKVPGTDYTYADTPYGLKVREATIDAFEVQDRRKAAEASEAYTREVKVEGDKARSEVQTLLAADPNAPIPDELMERFKKYDDTAQTKLVEWRRTLNTGVTDEAALRNVKEDLWASGGDTSVITKALDAGKITGQSLPELNTFAKALQDGKEGIEAIRRDPMFKDAIDSFEAQLVQRNDLGDPIKGTSNAAAAAAFDYTMMMAEFVAKNPDATFSERQYAMAQARKLITERIQPPEDFLSSGTYDRPQGPNDPQNPMSEIGKEQANRQGGEPGVEPKGAVRAEPTGNGTPPANDAAPDPKANDTAQDAEDAQTILDAMTPEQRQTFEAFAKQNNMTVEEYIQGITSQEGFKPNPAAPEDATAKPINATGGEKLIKGPLWLAEGLVRAATGASDGTNTATEFSYEAAYDYLQSALNLDEDEDQAAFGELPNVDDPSAQRLLKLIYQHEAAGNYNAVFGNAAATQDLSQFTLNEILAKQVISRRSGAASTAIGAPQFLYKTLKGLKKELKLTGNEMFTTKLQDQLAMALLVRRGWNQFKAGKLSQRAFAKRLSQEWASLPDPDTGRSYYDGDGLNASRIKPSAVYAALGFAPGPGEPPARQDTYGDPYINIPDVDAAGNPGQKQKFLEWNSDPMGNHAANLKSIDPTLAEVVTKAQELAGVRFVVGSGKRDAAMQAKAKEWGWSKTNESGHLDNGAADLWGIDREGAVTFDKTTQKSIVKAMRQAAKELGVELDIGADWKSFKDMPHFAIKKGKET